MPADSASRRLCRFGLGVVREAAPQPMDRRAAAEVRGDLVRGGDRGGAGQSGSNVNTTSARPAVPDGPLYGIVRKRPPRFEG